MVDSNGGEVKMWLTRLLCAKTCGELIELLEKSTTKLDLNKTGISLSCSAILSEEFRQAKEKPSDPTPTSQNIHSKTSNKIDICHSIEIKLGSLWQIIFKMKDRRNVKLEVNRQGVHRILSTLIIQTNRANWEIPINSKWLNLNTDK